jgi:O-antigen/teichoic acid export membrane protein
MANQLVLQYQVPLGLVGIYSVGYSVGSIVFELVVNGIHWAVLPFYYQTAEEESENKAKEIFAYVATCNTAVIFFLALFTILAGRELLGVFASAKYADAEGVVFLIAISCLFQYLFFIPSRGLYIKKKTLWLPLILFVTVALNISLSVLLIPPYGINGAAVATGGAYAARTILTFIISQKIYPIPYNYLKIVKAFLCLVVLVVAGKALPSMHFLLLLTCKALLLSLYPVLLYMVGFLERREIQYLHSAAMERVHKLTLGRQTKKAQAESVRS